MKRVTIDARWRRRGRPLVANSDAERCEALTVMTEWKIRNKREQRCPFVSKFFISGHAFCRHHAVMEAMAITMEKGIMTKIQRPVPVAGQHVPVAPKMRKRRPQ